MVLLIISNTYYQLCTWLTQAVPRVSGGLVPLEKDASTGVVSAEGVSAQLSGENERHAGEQRHGGSASVSCAAV